MFSGYFHMLERHADAIQRERVMETIQTIDHDRCTVSPKNDRRFVTEASDLGWTAKFLHQNGWPESVVFKGELLKRVSPEISDGDLVSYTYLGLTYDLIVFND